MERMLQKIAKQLCDFDEASLMELWERYTRKVARFEPSREWEEAAVVLTLIQGMRWKNQLFNHHWAESLKAAPTPPPADQLPVFSLHAPEGDKSQPGPASGSVPATGVHAQPVRQDKPNAPRRRYCETPRHFPDCALQE